MNTLYLLGDSTMADYTPDTAPMMGWGQALRELVPPTLSVDNHAMCGRSTKSFIDEGRLAAVEAKIQPGDWMLIQFGHNDEKILDPTRYTEPRGRYQENLRRMVDLAREHGAKPILLTSIARRNFVDDELVATHGEYPDAMREVAWELSVPLVDMERITSALLSALGEKDSVRLFCHVPTGHPNYPMGKQDNTHLRAHGAQVIAGLAWGVLKEIICPEPISVRG